MAITKVPKGIELITQFVLKQLGKKSLRKTGIATLNKASDPIVQSNVRNIKIQLKNLGINPEDLTSTDDVLKALNYHNALMNQHLKQQFKGLGLGKGIKSLEKKKTPVHKTELTDAELEAEYRRLSSLSPEDVKAEMRAQGLTPVEERPFTGWNPRVQQDIDGIIKNLKSMSPMDAMKEANLVIGRKGKYKNLSPDDSQRILKETDDHIFQRDIQYDEFGDPIKPDPEDFASGGIAGPLHLYEGGRANYDKGGMSRRGFLKTMAGLAAIPVIGKFFKWAKPLSKASGVITRGTDGIPTYVPDLIKVVKAKGAKEITEGLYKRSPPVHKWNYKGVEVAEDGMGNTSVRKNMEETKSWNTDNDVIIEDVVDREIGFEIRKGETVTTKKGKSVQTPDEYTENTAYMQGDPEGGVDVSDLAEVIEDADHLELKKIADESLIKKAEGGRVSLSKGGLAHVLGV